MEKESLKIAITGILNEYGCLHSGGKLWDEVIEDIRNEELIERLLMLHQKMSKCEICGKEGYHKMSCTTHKVTVFISDENPEQKDISKMETTESGSSEFPNNQADRKIGNSDFVICNRVNRTDNSRCVNCGAKTGHPCQMKPNECNYC